MIIEDTVTPELERIKKELERLHGKTVHIGVQGNGRDESGAGKSVPDEILTIAGVHEFGAVIKAKNVKNLAIPISKKAKGKSPRDFEGLFFLESDDLLYGCISKKKKGESKESGRPTHAEPKKNKPSEENLKTGKKDDIEFLFLLLPAVEIPERSFIRAGHEANKGNLEKVCMKAIEEIMYNNGDAEEAVNYIGMKAVGMIQEYMNTPGNFKEKGAVTKATSNWPDNPLVETGRLRNSITYIIEE
jgi:hypothetical protein